MVGIVSRADLLEFVLTEEASPPAGSDDDIEREITERLKHEAFCAGFFGVVKVSAGNVVLTGFANSEEVRRAVGVLIAQVPGVIAVDDRMQEMPPYIGPYYSAGGY